MGSNFALESFCVSGKPKVFGTLTLFRIVSRRETLGEESERDPLKEILQKNFL